MSYPSTQYAFGFDVSFLLRETDISLVWQILRGLGLESAFSDTAKTDNPLVQALNGMYLSDMLENSPLILMQSQQTDEIYLICGVQIVSTKTWPAQAGIKSDLPEFPTSFELRNWSPSNSMVAAVQPYAFVAPAATPQLHYICGY